jgi:WD40 repeat protein
MDHRDEPFSPETIDEQVEQFLELSQAHEQAHTSPAQVVQTLQGIYAEDPRLRRVWERLTEHLPMAHTNEEAGKEQAPHATIVKFPQERVQHIMQTQTRIPEQERRHGTFQRRLGLLVAALIMAALVGSMALVLQLTHQKSTGQTQTSSAQTSTPQTGSGAGKIIYSAPITNANMGYVGWSADGQRIAVADNPTLIWDATTGKHRIALSLDAPSPVAMPAWSPTGELLAIPGTNSILIVNGLSGKTIATYSLPASALALTHVPSTGSALSALLPLSGMPNFESVAWSPDGKLIASTFSSGTADGLVQVWNPQTGQVAFTLAKKAGYGYSDIAWSSDGKYLAVITWNWGGGGEKINVWSLQTRQIVFQQSATQGFSGLSWQPGTDNLASSLVIPGSNSNLPSPAAYNTPTPAVYNTTVLQIWNVTTRQLLKTLPGVGGSSLAWSPDGQKIAYDRSVSSTSSAGVTILDINSGQEIYTYQVALAQGQYADLSAPAWSPDGKYIATIAFGQTPIAAGSTAALPTVAVSTTSRTGVVQVWVA